MRFYAVYTTFLVINSDFCLRVIEYYSRNVSDWDFKMGSKLYGFTAINSKDRTTTSSSLFESDKQKLADQTYNFQIKFVLTELGILYSHSSQISYFIESGDMIHISRINEPKLFIVFPVRD